MKFVVALIVGCLCATGADAAVTYAFSSTRYTSVGGTGYSTSMSISGSITTGNPLPPNMPLTDIGPAGSNLVASWALSDGVHTFTQANSGPWGGTSGSFRVATNAAGRITVFFIKLMSPSAANAFAGSWVNVLTMTTLPEMRGESGGFCTRTIDGLCQTVSAAPNFGATSTTRAFDIDGDGRADALTDGLLLLRYLFTLRGASLIQGAVAAGATRTTQGEIEAWLGTFAP